MHSLNVALLADTITSVTAQFQLSFPPPRGPFVEGSETTFCDNHPHAASNRCQFPLSKGFITLNSVDPSWNLGVLVSTVQDPTSFEDFTSTTGKYTEQDVRNFASTTGEGDFCISLDLSKTGIKGVQDDANVTIQLIYYNGGGDGNLYQCADLTLSKSFNIPSDIKCSNASTNTPAGLPAQTLVSGARGESTPGVIGALGLIAALVFAL
ncbi:hypothetical protein BC834DRAFT_447603 [Gloeopeniophorella convolvens]|nr:hypothetical protein BC834DRAFT_447603 [Gloeopeniophorella convolvens]